MATTINSRDLMLQGSGTGRYYRSSKIITSTATPWTNLYIAGSSISNVTPTVSSSIYTTDGSRAATQFVLNTSASVIHGIGSVNLTTSMVTAVGYPIQAAVYYKGDGNSYSPAIAFGGMEIGGTNATYLSLRWNAETGITASGIGLGAGWTNASYQTYKLNNGWFKSILRGTYTPTDSLHVRLLSTLQIYNSSGAQSFTGDGVTGPYIDGWQFYLNEQPDEVIGDTWIDTTTSSTKLWNGYSFILASATAKTLAITNSAQTFTYDGNGTASPSGQFVKLDAVKRNTTATVTWSTSPSVTLYNASSGGSITTTGDTIYMRIADYGANTAVAITATATDSITMTDATTIIKVQAGTTNVVGYLTNESFVSAANSDGTGASLTGSGGTFKLYSGVTDVTTSGAFLVNGGATSVSNGLTASIVAGTGVYSFSGTWSSASNFESYTFTGVYNGVTATKIYSIAKSKTGTQGPAVTITANKASKFNAGDGALTSTSPTDDIIYTANIVGITSPVYTWSFAGFQSSPTNSTVSTQTITSTQFGTSTGAIVNCTVTGTANSAAVTAIASESVVRLEKSSAAASATVGATIGTNLSGSITPANSTTFISENAIRASHIILGAISDSIGNLILNGSFDDGTIDNWVLTEGTGGSLTAEVVSGIAYAKLASGVYTAYGTKAMQVVPGETYVLKYRTKNLSTATSGNVYVTANECTSYPSNGYATTANRNSTTFLISLPASAVTTSWSNYSVTYTVPAGVTWISIAFYNWLSSAYLAIDTVNFGRQIIANDIKANTITANEISVGAIKAQHIFVAPKSLNIDPNFASGSTIWAGFVQRLAASNTAVPTGCPVAYASSFNLRDGPSILPIEVVPGEQYKLSCWVNKGTGGGGVGIGIYVGTRDYAGADISTLALVYTNASGWNRVYNTYTIPAGAATLRFGPWADRSTYTGEAWYADLSVEKVNDATLIVDGSITSNKLTIKGQGKAINVDPFFSDITAWTYGGEGSGSYSIISSSTAPSGNTILTTNNGIRVDSKEFNVTPGTKYKVSFWARRLTGTGTIYARLIRYTTTGTNVGQVISASPPYTGTYEGLDSPNLTSTWTKYSGYATIESTAVVAKLAIWSNWNTTGTCEIADFRCEEYVGSDIIVVDGTITIPGTANAGFRAGSLQWNTAGVRTSGSGIALNAGGLLAYNSGGTKTIELKASDGSAYFAGPVIANNSGTPIVSFGTYSSVPWLEGLSSQSGTIPLTYSDGISIKSISSDESMTLYSGTTSVLFTSNSTETKHIKLLAEKSTSSTTLAAIPGMSFPLAASTTYKVSGVLKVKSSTSTVGFGIGCNTPTTTVVSFSADANSAYRTSQTLSFYKASSGANANMGGSFSTHYQALDTAPQTFDTSAYSLVTFDAIIETGTTAGNFNLAYAVGSTGTIYLGANSTMSLYKLTNNTINSTSTATAVAAPASLPSSVTTSGTGSNNGKPLNVDVIGTFNSDGTWIITKKVQQNSFVNTTTTLYGSSSYATPTSADTGPQFEILFTNTTGSPLFTNEAATYSSLSIARSFSLRSTANSDIVQTLSTVQISLKNVSTGSTTTLQTIALDVTANDS